VKRMVGAYWERRACPKGAKASVVGDAGGRKAPTSSPGSERTAWREGTRRESTEPLAGRRGRKAQRGRRV
jgi:hypothetical protein